MQNPVIGIDLGTSNSAAAIADDDGVRVLADAQGHAIQPSVVSFHPNGAVIVGASAKQRRVLDPHNTIYSAKRLIGRTYDSREVRAAAARVPYAIKQGVNSQPVVVTRAGEFAIPELSAIMLDHLRGLAQSALGTEIRRAVVAVPANFTDTQRSATVTAGDIAGIEVVQVINEPTAAALAYGHRRGLNQRVAVYDFGGGTFDVTLLEVRGTVYEVLATAGDPFLGGDDMDERLVETMLRLFREQQGIDLHDDQVAMQRLRTVAEQIKIELSRRPRARVTIDQLAQGPDGASLDFSMRITRDDLEAHAAELVDRSFAVCSEAMTMAGLRASDIGDVILVGGTTKMPLVRRKVSEFFGTTPRTDVHPDEAVALGAAIHGQAIRPTLDRSPRRARRRNTAPGLAPPAPPLTAMQPVSQDGGSPWERGSTMPWASFAEDLEPGNQVGGRRLDTLDVPTMERELGIGPLELDGDILPAPRRQSSMGEHTEAEPTALMPGRGHAAAPDDQGGRAESAGDGATNVHTGDIEAVLPGDGATNVHTRDIEAVLPALPEPSQPYVAPDANQAAGQAADAGISLPEAHPAAAAEWPAAPDEPPIILEVTPHSLGVATVAGFCRLLIPRNTRVPAEASQIFTTSKNLQETVRIRVCQGESRRLDDNTALGDLVLDGLEPRPRGETRIEVTFGFDESGILHVRARDLNTGREQHADLQVAGAPTPEEITEASARLRRLRD